MTLPEPPLRRLSNSGLRNVLYAPELERFLARGSVDVNVVDQVESLKVRVRRGLDVLENRVRAAIAAARLRLQWNLLGLAVAAGGLGAALLGLEKHPLAAGGLGAGIGAALVYLGVARARLRADLRLLGRLRRGYRDTVEGCDDLHELLDLAQRIFDDVRLLAGPEEEEASDAG